MEDHPGSDIHENSGKYNWIPDFVYGGIDGAVTTFAVVAGVEGASLSVPIILILGFANLFADGFSMATGKYSSDKANEEQYEKIKRTEYAHLKSKTEHEKGEVREIMAKYNFKGKDLDRAVEIITADEDAWVDLMMRNEFNMTQENVDAKKGAIATFISFILIGSIPLLGYIFKPFLGLSDDNTFILTAVSTLFALFLVGTIKSRFTLRHWFVSGLETAGIGGIAASIAYLVGYLLRGLAGM
jgi:VIT1/CCC1 family predicted Fe2+/Mn2+ transporter